MTITGVRWHLGFFLSSLHALIEVGMMILCWTVCAPPFVSSETMASVSDGIGSIAKRISFVLTALTRILLHVVAKIVSILKVTGPSCRFHIINLKDPRSNVPNQWHSRDIMVSTRHDSEAVPISASSVPGRRALRQEI